MNYLNKSFIDNFTVLITGAAGLIGSELARGIIENNGKVILVDVNERGIDNLSTELPSENILKCVADASDVNQIDQVINLSIEKFGKIDAAIHSSYPKSSAWGTNFESLEYKYLSQDISSQLGGAIIFSQRILNYFINEGKGNLIHVSSIQGISTPKFEHYINTNMFSPIEYSAVKSGLISITRYLAKYYKGKNIRINSISPGGILNDQPISFIERYKDSCNSKGMLDARDLLGAVLFLISNHSQYVNGQNLVIDDGWSL